jgi:hypothetical protein
MAPGKWPRAHSRCAKRHNGPCPVLDIHIVTSPVSETDAECICRITGFGRSQQDSVGDVFLDFVPCSSRIPSIDRVQARAT